MVEKVLAAMIAYFEGDVRRVNHFIKVYGFAQAIGAGEGLDERSQEALELAALTHDIGIKVSEAKYGYNNGPLQEQEGPPEARSLLEGLWVPGDVVERVCALVGRHHHYRDIEDPCLQILIEADFLVNAYEDESSHKAITTFRDKVFKTKTGRQLLRTLYGV
jgi:hypothetical protein